MLKAVAEKLHNVDRVLFRSLFRVKWPPLTVVMRWFTIAGTAGFLWGVLAAIAFIFTGLHFSHLIIPWLAVGVSWTAAEGAKLFFNRTRPFLADTEIAPLIKTPSSSSFPSGHSATAAGGSLALAAIYPSWAPVLLLGGAMVALSRIYLGVHYPLDVLAGVSIGVLVAVVLLVIA